MIYIDYDNLPSFNGSFSSAFAIGDKAYIDIPKTKTEENQ